MFCLAGCGAAAVGTPNAVTNPMPQSAPSSPAVAVDFQQVPLRPNLPPIRGEISIGASIAGGASRTNVDTGGIFDIENYHLAPHCVGYLDNAPMVNLTLTQATPFLRVFVEKRDTGDATLVIRKPDGSYICNDDGGDAWGTSPLLDLTDLAAGTYNVWTGNALSQAHGDATLVVSMNHNEALSAEAASHSAAVVQAPLDTQTTHGIAHKSFRGAFNPEAVRVNASGPIDASHAQLGQDCRGNVTALPTYVAEVTGAMPYLRFFTSGSGANVDATMLVLGPDGHWLCGDDDGNSKEAFVEYTSAAPGTYRIWIGRYGAQDVAPTTLNITRRVRDNHIDPGAAPSGGTAHIAPNFSPDPQSVEVAVGGLAELTRISGTVNGSCHGVSSQAPTYAYELRATMPFVRFYVPEAPVDMTMAVQKPDGTWSCNDDSFNGQMPTVDINNPTAGTYRVWLGVYRGTDQTRVRLNATHSIDHHP